jgi:hypothetical protein
VREDAPTPIGFEINAEEWMKLAAQIAAIRATARHG